ncbi:CAP-Gly domain-containing linker protein [Actinidia chinensis var. chinensis]|uniref:CAP-Gly domain-containing linker protein n=1 Tax=Actinidia chinensis var. chinensis TaxID=1590841 RepID=A0A2R6RDR7_ACTCC|nr:CAP-Gly domain-containing linker protein [Actinidia chinensis var. chinensis]
MAKKKATHQDKPAKNQDPTHQSPTAMAEASEKLENLKSLNYVLLKEAVERRQQVDSLQNSIGSMESALTRSESENRGLQDELTRLRDCTAQLELERYLVPLFVSVQVREQEEVVKEERDGFWRERVEFGERLRCLEREMGEVLREKSEIERARSEREAEIGVLKGQLRDIGVEIEAERDVLIRVSRERDDLKVEFDVQIEETSGLRIKLTEAEKRENKMEEEVQKLKVEYNGVMEEREERERRIASMATDNDSIKRCLAESNRVIEGLKREIEEMVREKEGIEEERNMEVRKKNELEIAVASLNDLASGLIEAEKNLLLKVEDLEKRCGEVVEKEKRLVKEYDAIVREKKERERSFEGLLEEKVLVKKELDWALKDLDEQKRRMDELVRKKTEIEEAKTKRESEIVELEREVSELRGAISALEVSCNYQKKKNGQLQCEVHRYKDSIEQVGVERDEARKGFEEEKRNGEILRGKILVMEKKIEEAQKVVGEMKAKYCSLLGEKKEIESGSTVLLEEIASLEDNLSRARKEVDDMKANVELADAKSVLVFEMLKNTVKEVISHEGDSKEDGGFMNEREVGESVKPYMAELEAIKNAFKSREVKIEEMKRQEELLQNSVAEAHEGKSFWTLVSSATTILAAAASVAYVASGH